MAGPWVPSPFHTQWGSCEPWRLHQINFVVSFIWAQHCHLVTCVLRTSCIIQETKKCSSPEIPNWSSGWLDEVVKRGGTVWRMRSRSHPSTIPWSSASYLAWGFRHWPSLSFQELWCSGVAPTEHPICTFTIGCPFPFSGTPPPIFWQPNHEWDEA